MLRDFLLSIAANVNSEVIIAIIKKCFCQKKYIDQEELKHCLKKLGLLEVQAKAIIKFLADEGFIKFSGKKIFAENKILYKSLSSSSHIEIGSGVVSKTLGTRIETGGTGNITIRGKAFISQS